MFDNVLLGKEPFQLLWKQNKRPKTNKSFLISNLHCFLIQHKSSLSNIIHPMNSYCLPNYLTSEISFQALQDDCPKLSHMLQIFE